MRWLLQILMRRRRYDELSQSIREHLEEKVADLVDRGMTPQEAERIARREFGNVALVEERSREVWQWPAIETFWADIRYALRQLRRAPSFSATTIVTLALGIGATTAIFTLVHAVLLKSLPVVRPGELYRIGDKENCCAASGLQGDWSLFSGSLYRYFRSYTPGFDQLAAMDAATNLVAVRRNGSSQPAIPMTNEFVSGNYFSAFGLTAFRGRTLADGDDRPGAAPVAVMSFRTWEQRYAGDPAMIGSAFDIDGHVMTIVGIAPPGFFGDRMQQNPPSFWIPLTDDAVLLGTNSILNRPNLHWLDLIGRVQPGVSPIQLQARLQVELRQWLLSPESGLSTGERRLVARQVLRLTPGGGGIRVMQDQYRDGLRLLMGISLFVLAIVCANLANLMLVRTSSRRQLISVRAALGASSGRLIRQAITESVVLAFLGGVAGLGVAFASTRMILHLAFPNAYVPIDTAPELHVLLFALAAVLLTGLLFGIAPAWMMQRANPADALRGAGRIMRRGSSMAQKLLVTGQAALSLVLLGVAGMLTASLANVQHQHFGFDPSHRTIVHIDPQMASYKPDQTATLFRRIRSSLESIPGIDAVSFSLYSPMEGVNPNDTVFLEGQAPPAPDSDQNNASWNRVTPGYFATLGTSLLQGRSFSDGDTSHGQKVAVVNQAFARKFFGNKSPLGMHFGRGSASHVSDFEIVGVTENTQYQNPADPVPPMYFLPFAQSPADGSRFLSAIEIRSSLTRADLESRMRRTIARIAPDLTILDVSPLSDQVNAALRQQSIVARLTSLFGVLALVLAAVGLYGVTAWLVEQQRSEIGIRMALGARRSAILRLILRQASMQVGAGLVIGIPLAILSAHGISGQLFGVRPSDPLALGGAALMLGVAAAIAAMIPARRAARIDPIQALHSE